MKITKENLKDIELYYHPKQKKDGWINGTELYQYLRDENLLEDCLTLENLKEIQSLGSKEFNTYFKDKYVVAWNSVEDDFVWYLYGFVGKVVLSRRWVGHDFYRGYPALLLRKSFVLNNSELSHTLSLDLPNFLSELKMLIQKYE